MNKREILERWEVFIFGLARGRRWVGRVASAPNVDMLSAVHRPTPLLCSAEALVVSLLDGRSFD